MDWNSLKDEAARMLLEKDALHIYAALLVQLAVARLSNRSLGAFLPWFSVLGLELVNETIDLVRGGEPRLMPWQVVSAVHDIINTMILPTVLLILCRRAPRLLAWSKNDPPAGECDGLPSRSIVPADRATAATALHFFDDVKAAAVPGM